MSICYVIIYPPKENDDLIPVLFLWKAVDYSKIYTFGLCENNWIFRGTQELEEAREQYKRCARGKERFENGITLVFLDFVLEDEKIKIGSTCFDSFTEFWKTHGEK